MAGGPEAVHAATLVGEAAEQMAVLPLGPVLIDGQDREWATPVREMELGGTCLPAVIGLQADPRLERPVRLPQQPLSRGLKRVPADRSGEIPTAIAVRTHVATDAAWPVT